MTLKTGPNLGQIVSGAAGEGHYAELLRQWRAIDALVQPSVISRVAAVPTTGMADGDRYLVTGTTNQNKIARYSLGSAGLADGWEYYTPKAGWRIYVAAEGADYQFNGSSWAVAGGSQVAWTNLTGVPVNVTALGGLSGAADTLPYFTGAGALSLATLTAQARTLLAATSQAGQRTALGLGTAAMLTAQTTPTDYTTGRAALVGMGGIGAYIDLRTTPKELGAPSDIYGTGTQFGFARGGSDGVGIPALGTMAYGVLQASGQWSDGTGGNGVSRVFWYGPRLFMQGMSGATWSSWMEALSSGNASALPITGSLSPATDNAVSFGLASQRASVVYAGTGTINTSDAREKTPLRVLVDAELTAAKQLATEIGAYQFLAAVAEKGAEAARQHIGMTVQRAIEIMQANSLDPFGYGFICYDQWGAQTVDHPAEYEKVQQADGSYADGALVREAWIEVVREAGDRYSFRMDELLAFIARGQAVRLDALESRLAAIGG